MHVSFDISALPYGTGVSMYSANLARALSNLPDIKLTLFGSSMRQTGVIRDYAALNRVKASIYPLPPRITAPLLSSVVPIDLLTQFPDIFHSWDWYLPKSIRAKVITTVHDVAQFKYPEIAHPQIRAHHQQVLKSAKQRHLHLIAVSDSTKQDMIEIFGFNPDLIHVVHEALPEEQCIPVTDDYIKEVKKKHHLTKPYLLIVGTKEPRKNVPRQIEAWRKFQDEFDLVIVGKSGWEEISNESGIHIFDYVAGQDLAALYRGASVLLYASLAEGFGLPILEAFYHHTPVVTSNRSSLAEIAGDAAVLVDPEQTESIIAGIATALEDGNELSAKSMTRLNDFSWAKAAAETVEVYKKVINKD
jgi:glycosyltransferase involved in cell wall biosynthesis